MRLRTLSRREALKRAGATLGAISLPTILPGSIFGQNAPSNRVSLAAIGVGSRGTEDCKWSFLPLEDVRLVAAADCRKSNRERFAKMVNDHYKADVCTPYGDFRDVLVRKDVRRRDHQHGGPLARAAGRVCRPGGQGRLRGKTARRLPGMGVETPRGGGPAQDRLPIRNAAARRHAAVPPRVRTGPQRLHRRHPARRRLGPRHVVGLRPGFGPALRLDHADRRSRRPRL